MGRSVDEAIKEKAFQIWRKNGRSPEKTAKALCELGHKISRKAIDDWKKERDWVSRAAEADAVERQVNDPELSADERLIAALAKRQRWYEKYFEDRGPKELDTQADYAFTNLCGTLQGIQQKSAAYKSEMFTVFLRDFIGWLHGNDPASVPVLEKNFDDFIAFAKEKYKR